MRVTALLLLATAGAWAQSYAPAAGMPGTQAIHRDSPAFVAWATGIEVTRGHVKISDPSLTVAGSNYASAGGEQSSLGFPDGGSVSLGDGGVATLTFQLPITNGSGFDFAVFETGTPDYLELAFVEASSDGVTFFRFPSHSQTQADTQIGTFGSPQPEYINNLAGKYGGVYGTPFDLSDLPDNPMLDKSAITHLRIIDVVGSIDPEYARCDSFGTAINDSFPTPFGSCGFDLQGVGVLHQLVLGTDEAALGRIRLYPNPAENHLYIDVVDTAYIYIYNTKGELVMNSNQNKDNLLDVSGLSTGLYFVNIVYDDKHGVFRFVKNKS